MCTASGIDGTEKMLLSYEQLDGFLTHILIGQRAVDVMHRRNYSKVV